LIVLLANGNKYDYNLNGSYLSKSSDDNDLFLDLETPWIKPLEEGDVIEVLESSKWNGTTRIFIYEDKDGNAIAKSDVTTSVLFAWAKCDWRRKSETPKEAKLEIKITINGEEKSLEEFKEIIKSL
jgi:hypothetical protein